jgi:2-polyprenyl-3-methyl-5-hydroxy-6-metoxy-1,4-benzoquinol methylase
MDAAAWDERYRSASANRHAHLWSEAPHLVVQQIIDGLAPGTVLDLATGDGRNALYLAAHGWEVTAVDFSAEAIRIARTRATAAKVSVDWVVADIAEYEPERRFDLVLATYLYLYTTDNLTMLRRATTWVAPGGHLLVLGHDRENLTSGAPGPADPEILYTRQLLEQGAAGLRIERSEQLTRDTRVDPESPYESARTAIDTLLYATRD